jgi:hypothetical protein
MDAALQPWNNFFIAETGAAAALSGLVIVAISINLSQILAHPQLPGRAGETLLTLVGVLVVSTLALVPGQPRWLLASEWLGAGGAMWLLPTIMVLRGLRLWREQPLHWLWIRIVLMQAASLPFMIAGGATLLGAANGIYWIVPGVVFSLVGAVINTWVLLIEILR